MTMHAQPIERWPDAIEAVLAHECSIFKRLTLLRQTASTQDHARLAGARAGDVVVAWRQTAGRGRLGRAWADTGTDGIAVTFVAPRGEPEALVMACAVAAARALSRFLPADRAGIKWPNDIVAGGRKLGGILVEQTGTDAHIGIGCNVSQLAFEAELDGIATSLAREGSGADRLDVLCELARALDAALRAEPDAIYRTYQALDRLSGQEARFLTPAGLVEGRVQSVDPRRGLEVETAAGRLFLPASTTSVVPADAPRRYGGANDRA